VLWRFQTGGNVSGSPTGANGVVYFGSSDNKLYALYTTGTLRWYYQTGAMINQSAPYLVNGVVYVGSRDNYLHAVNASDGTMIWKYSTNGISLEQSSPTVANGLVYIGSWYNVPSYTIKGSLYAVNTSGVLVWEKLINTGISSSPCVANGNVYITGDDTKIYALNAVNGASLWEKVIVPNGASPAVGLKTVYVGGGGTGYFYALETTTGTEIWRFPTPNGLMTSRPLIIYNL
jgi:outer membrane protein assembly factor BamB